MKLNPGNKKHLLVGLFLNFALFFLPAVWLGCSLAEIVYVLIRPSDIDGVIIRNHRMRMNARVEYSFKNEKNNIIIGSNRMFLVYYGKQPGSVISIIHRGHSAYVKNLVVAIIIERAVFLSLFLWAFTYLLIALRKKWDMARWIKAE